VLRPPNTGPQRCGSVVTQIQIISINPFAWAGTGGAGSAAKRSGGKCTASCLHGRNLNTEAFSLATVS
jgi:hypothetical protein